MIVARTPRQIAPFDYDDIIRSIDWNRVLIQAAGLHYSMGHHVSNGTEICGNCVQTVLLRRED